MDSDGGEAEDLRTASSDGNFVLELELDGTIRYVSVGWGNVVGIPSSEFVGRPISSIISGHPSEKQVFASALRVLQEEDDSVPILFSVKKYSKPADLSAAAADAQIDESALLPDEFEQADTFDTLQNQPSDTVQIEGQGVLITQPDGEKYSLWVLRPYVHRSSAAVALPEGLMRAVGFGVEALAEFLEKVVENVQAQLDYVPAPPQELCRICERFIPTWYFERHTELCILESKIESRIVEYHENLVEHRTLLTSLISRSGEQALNYKGLPLPTSPSLRPRSSSGNRFAVRVSSPLATPRRKDGPENEFLASLVEITEIALSIDIPDDAQSSSDASSQRGEDSDATNDSIHDSSEDLDLDSGDVTIHSNPPNDYGDSTVIITKQSPSDSYAQFDERILELIHQVEMWEPPMTTSLALQALGEDTKQHIQKKASAVVRMKHFLQYSKRIHVEIDRLVHEAIEDTVVRARQLEGSGTTSRASEQPSEGNDTIVDVDTDDDDDDNDHAVVASDTDSGRDVLLPFLEPPHDPGTRRRSSRLVGPAVTGHILPPSAPPAQRRRSSATSQGGSPNSSPWHSPMHSPRLSPWPGHINIGAQRMSTVVQSRTQSGIPSPSTPSGWSLGTPAGRFRERSMSSISSHLNSSDDERRLSISKASMAKVAPPSIRDFEIIRPISRGAFGTVYLTRKRLTGDYFAIKALKKSDMVEKNQVGNVRAERAIMISTADSPYVAKLYFTFQSREYLYLVMEYLHGGDLAALIGALGCLPEDWSRFYIAETIVAVHSLHAEGIIHRDLKPDNVLITYQGHLKLSDFGLSVKGLARKNARFHLGEYMSKVESEESKSPASNSQSPSTSHEGSGSYFSDAAFLQEFVPQGKKQKFGGTPDYLAPETIKGDEQSETTDWWSLGCILFELSYGYPPFNDETPQKVFDNILARKIFWPKLDSEHDITDVTKDLINKLLDLDPQTRLGANGVEEIKSHPFFANLQWSSLFQQEPPFVPKIENPESTEYFDDRGAMMPEFEEDFMADTDTPRVDVQQRHSSGSGSDTATSNTSSPANSLSRNTSSQGMSQHRRSSSFLGSSRTGDVSSGESWGMPAASKRSSRLGESPSDEFGSFSFKNLPVLEKANHDVISKLRTESTDRRLSISSSVMSSGSWADSPQQGSLMDTSPYSSDTEGAQRNAALLRVNRRRNENRKSFSQLGGSGGTSSSDSPTFFVDVLTGIGNANEKQVTEGLLTGMDCRIVSCNSGDELLRRALSPVKFDIIFLDDELNTNLPISEIRHVIQATIHTNSSTPIVKLSPDASSVTRPFAAGLKTPVTASGLEEILKSLFLWHAPTRPASGV